MSMTEIVTRSGWGDSPCNNNVSYVSTATTAYSNGLQHVWIGEVFPYMNFFFCTMSKCYRFKLVGYSAPDTAAGKFTAYIQGPSVLSC